MAPYVCGRSPGRGDEPWIGDMLVGRTTSGFPNSLLETTSSIPSGAFGAQYAALGMLVDGNGRVESFGVRRPSNTANRASD